MKYVNQTLEQNVKDITETSKTIEELKEKLSPFFHILNEDEGKIVYKRKHKEQIFLYLTIYYEQKGEQINVKSYKFETEEIR